jgi:peptidoglycan hydrolase-like protein with peptidoglycan-binding domain
MQERNALFRELAGLGMYGDNESSLTGKELDGEVPIDSNAKAFVQWVQASLNGVQHSNLQVDGIAGPKTLSVVRTFRQNRGLPLNSLIDRDLQAALVQAGASPYSVPENKKSTMRQLLMPSNAKESICKQFFAGKSEFDIDTESLKEKFSTKITGEGAITEEKQASDDIKEYLLYDFEINGYYLKENHKKLIDELWQYMRVKSNDLKKQGNTDVKFQVKIFGYASRTAATSAKHNCLLSRERVKSTLEEFKSKWRGYEFEVVYLVDYFGYFETTREGEWDLGRSVRISIGKPGYTHPPIVWDYPGLATRFRIRCIKLDDWDLSRIGEEIEDRLLEKLFPNGTDYDKVIKQLISKLIKSDAARKALDAIIKKIPSLKKLNPKEKWMILKGIMKYIPGSMSVRTGKFEIETLDAKKNQIGIYNYWGYYLQLELKHLSTSKEIGSAWSEFEIKDTNSSHTTSPFKLALNDYVGPVFVGAGSFNPMESKKGALSFKNRNPRFMLGKFHETNPEPISFKLPSDESNIRFSPSDGTFTLISVRSLP